MNPLLIEHMSIFVALLALIGQMHILLYENARLSKYPLKNSNLGLK